MPKPRLTAVAPSHTRAISVAPSIGQLSDWSIWPPTLAIIDQVVPFLVFTLEEFAVLQVVLNGSIRFIDFFVILPNLSYPRWIKPGRSRAVIDRFIARRILLPTDAEDLYLFNIHGCIKLFLQIVEQRPVSEKRYAYTIRVSESVREDFEGLDIPLVPLTMQIPRLCPRPEKSDLVPCTPPYGSSLKSRQVSEFIYYFWGLALASPDPDLLNLFVINRLLEQTVSRGLLQTVTTTVKVCQYGQQNLGSIGLPDRGSPAEVGTRIQRVFDKGNLGLFRLRQHKKNPETYYVQVDRGLQEKILRCMNS